MKFREANLTETAARPDVWRDLGLALTGEMHSERGQLIGRDTTIIARILLLVVRGVFRKGKRVTIA